jgi:superfamily II DNA/RNA helicase
MIGTNKRNKRNRNRNKTITMLFMSMTSRQCSKKIFANAFSASRRSTTQSAVFRRNFNPIVAPSASLSSLSLSSLSLQPFSSSSAAAAASTKISATTRNRSRTRRDAMPTPHANDPELESLIQQATSTNDFFASFDQFPSFESIGVSSPVLIQRISQLLNDNSDNNDNDNTDNTTPKPSAIQAASYQAILSNKDVTIGAETGSGKTLAYLLPLIDDILQSKQKKLTQQQEGDDDDAWSSSGSRLTTYDYARAVILVPNKELAHQVIRMATPLCGGSKCVVWGPNGERQGFSNTAFGSSVPVEEGSTSTTDNDTNTDSKDLNMVRLGFLPGELKTPNDYKPFRLAMTEPLDNPPLDILVCTPAALGPWGLNPKNIDVFADIQTLVIDEADMLFDGGYLRQLENTLLGFKRADRLVGSNNSNPTFDESSSSSSSSFGIQKTQHVLVAATLPDMGLKSVDAYVQRKFPYATRVTMKGMHNARHYGLGQQTTWVEDDIDEMAPKRKRMETLVQMLKNTHTQQDHNDNDTTTSIGLAGEKVMIFLNNVNDVDSATNALRRVGIEAVPFHAKMPLAARTESLARFRKFVASTERNKNDQEEDGDDDGVDLSDAVSVLVCTDLAARGLDIPGVTTVIQLQFAGNVVTHLHRMGRCGRAGNRDGRGVIFYGGVESALVEVVREAEEQQETMVLKGSDIEEAEGDDNGANEKGKVQAAFSRKRGFTRKRKKLRKAAREEEEGIYYD